MFNNDYRVFWRILLNFLQNKDKPINYFLRYLLNCPRRIYYQAFIVSLLLNHVYLLQDFLQFLTFCNKRLLNSLLLQIILINLSKIVLVNRVCDSSLRHIFLQYYYKSFELIIRFIFIWPIFSNLILIILLIFPVKFKFFLN